MPLTLSAAFQTHLDGTLTTLTSLWKVTRVDGTVLYFTDHDEQITFDGNDYIVGVGYDRSAVEDKGDLSVDNMDVSGILETTAIDREDIRGGLYDGAEVLISIVNYKDLTQGALVRRRGWFGALKQNNLGQFNTELRGMAEAFSETLVKTYTPACPVDLGSTACGIPLTTPLDRVDDTRYIENEWIFVYEYPDLIFRCSVAGTVADTSSFDPAIYDVAEGAVVVDGNATFVATYPFENSFIVSVGGDRQTFDINVNEPRMNSGDSHDDPSWFNGGLLRFTTGDNASISREIQSFNLNSANDGEIFTYMRFPFNVQAGDIGIITPACHKTISDCKNKFANMLNYQGYPYLPGELYMRDFPDAK